LHPIDIERRLMLGETVYTGSAIRVEPVDRSAIDVMLSWETHRGRAARSAADTPLALGPQCLDSGSNDFPLFGGEIRLYWTKD